MQKELSAKGVHDNPVSSNHQAPSHKKNDSLPDTIYPVINSFRILFRIFNAPHSLQHGKRDTFSEYYNKKQNKMGL